MNGLIVPGMRMYRYPLKDNEKIKFSVVLKTSFSFLWGLKYLAFLDPRVEGGGTMAKVQFR
jgi:hypothetical protein